MKRSLQDTYGPNGHCFGCGPKNEKGLQIKSFATEGSDITLAHFTPEKHHEAFDGAVNGGIIGTLLDCHSNWTAAYSLMKAQDQTEPPWTVTAEFSVKLLAPTPSDQTLEIRAWPSTIEGRKAFIEAEVWAGKEKTAHCKGLFIAVRQDHPAYRRWE